MCQKKRIVLTTSGSLGDLHPYLALARELRLRGHSPVIAASNSYREKIEADGIEFALCRPSKSDFGDPAKQLPKINHAILGTTYVIRRLLLWLRESYADLDAAAAHADLIVAHPLSYAASIVADRRGIPWVGTLLQPMGCLSAFDPPVLPIIGRLPFGRGINQKIFSILRWSCRHWLDAVRQLRAELGLPAVSMDPFLGTPSHWMTLGLFSPLLGSPQPDWPKPVKVTGFVFYDEGGIAYEKPDPRLKPFLDGGPPPIVFTLGSSVVKTAGTFFPESIAAARRLNVRAIVVTGRDTPEPGNLPPHILAVPYAPYGYLFPRARLVVHHGGAGTTAQALRAGNPQLVVPKAHDQPDHAARIARMGCGLALRRSRYKAATVAAEIEKLLANAKMARAAEQASATIRAERGTAWAADELERLAGA